MTTYANAPTTTPMTIAALAAAIERLELDLIRLYDRTDSK